jgi:hypothetical protein
VIAGKANEARNTGLMYSQQYVDRVMNGTAKMPEGMPMPLAGLMNTSKGEPTQHGQRAVCAMKASLLAADGSSGNLSAWPELQQLHSKRRNLARPAELALLQKIQKPLQGRWEEKKKDEFNNTFTPCMVCKSDAMPWLVCVQVLTYLLEMHCSDSCP